MTDTEPTELDPLAPIYEVLLNLPTQPAMCGDKVIEQEAIYDNTTRND